MVSNININFSISLPGTVNRSAAHSSPAQTTRGHAQISTLGCWQMICAVIFQQDILKEKTFLSLCVLVRTFGTSKGCLRIQTRFCLDIFAVIN